MGIITKIEDKLGDIVENPFRDKNSLDLLGIEISLKRLMELKRKNILGKVIVPNDLFIIINKKAYEEYELFLHKFKATLVENLYGWMREKGYEMADKMALHFKGGLLENKLFEVFVSYEKVNSGNGNIVKKDSNVPRQKGSGEGNKIIVGELVNKRTREIFRINQDTTTIGRQEDCTIRISDPTVSRKHAFLSYQNGKVILEDLESKCGTWVNHQKITKEILRQGDRIMIGSTELTYLDPWSNSWKSKDDSPHDTEMKETSQKVSKAENKMNSSDPNVWGLSYFF